MKIFIFDSVENLTNSYHHDGGLVIIALSLKRALELARNYRSHNAWSDDDKSIQLSAEEIENVIEYDLINSPEERVFIFPNEGCC